MAGDASRRGIEKEWSSIRVRWKGNGPGPTALRTEEPDPWKSLQRFV